MHKLKCTSTSSMCCARGVQAPEAEAELPAELQRTLARLADERLHELRFSGLASSHAQTLGLALADAAQRSSLQRLRLEECRITAEAVQHWAPRALSELKELKVLNLAHNQLEVRGLEIVVQALGSSQLEELVLTDNLLGPKAGQLVAELLLQVPSLATVDLSENFLQEEGAAMIAKVLRGRPVLATRLSLDLSSNDLRVAGAKALASLLEMDAVRSMELASNRLHDFGIKAMAQVLKGNRCLTFLGLQENNISDEGVTALLEACENEKLQTLELDYNAISDAALAALTAAMPTCWITSAGNRPKQPGMMSGSVTRGYGA